jgi:hypothetical protein
MDADSWGGVCVNYKASKPVSLYHRINEKLDGEFKCRTTFSAGSFAKAIKKIGVGQDDKIKYFGYSVWTGQPTTELDIAHWSLTVLLPRRRRFCCQAIQRHA